MKAWNKRIQMIALLLPGLLLFAFLPDQSTKMFVSNYENVLGTSMEIKLDAKKEKDADAAEQAALIEVDRLNKILSGYDARSEFSQWMQAEKKPITVSPELFEVLSLFEKWRLKTDGALDASAETITKLWRNTASENRLPSDNDIAQALQLVHQQHYILNKEKQTAHRLSDAPLMLNSFAKSYIMNKAADVAIETGNIEGLVLNIGGDILVRGNHTELIQVADPKSDAENDMPVATIKVNNKTIATSGNYRRGVSIGGKWYSHIVDPRSGKPASEVISATVVANDAADAGALATALNVLSPEEGDKLVSSVPGAEYMLMTSDGKRMESKGWKKIAQDDPRKPSEDIYQAKKDKTWDTDYELAIAMELATIQEVRTHRPYVAVWVTDKDKKPVRLISLWYAKPRWLNDLRSWYAAYGSQFTAGGNNISSTSSATRSAGKYTLKWDGKDDAGKPVPEGVYTIHIEAAREHGTHQLMEQQIDVKKQKHWELPGNVEIASVTLDYKKANGK